jgi:hypothetical protein
VVLRRRGVDADLRCLSSLTWRWSGGATAGLVGSSRWRSVVEAARSAAEELCSDLAGGGAA